jgi:hypothetical protein
LAGEQRIVGFAKDLVLIAAPLLATIVAAAIVLSGRAAGFSTKIGTEGYDFVTSALVSCILISGIVYGLKRHPERLARVLVSCITLAGTTSGLVLFKVWFETTGATPALFLIALPLGYLGVRWSVKGYYGSLSPRKSTLVAIGSATLLGALIGTSLPPLFTIAFLATLAIMDFLVVETNVLTRLIGPQRYGEVLSLTTVPPGDITSRSWGLSRLLYARGNSVPAEWANRSLGNHSLGSVRCPDHPSDYTTKVQDFRARNSHQPRNDTGDPRTLTR